jgi:hypothetical protein
MGSMSHKSWFGPKRIGVGLRPQTWQGWAIMAIFTAIVVIVAFFVH